MSCPTFAQPSNKKINSFGFLRKGSEKEFICWLHSSSHCNLYSFQTDSFFFNTMGGCASKPKESDILETSAVTENAVVESKNVESEAVSQVLWIKYIILVLW